VASGILLVLGAAVVLLPARSRRSGRPDFRGGVTRGRTAAFLTAVLAISLLAWAGSSAPKIREEWYRYQAQRGSLENRLHALQRLGVLGSPGAVDILARIAEQEGVKQPLGLAAAQALIRTGKPGLDAFIDRVGVLRLYAALEASGDDLKVQVVPLAVDALQDPDFLVMYEGASLLGRLGPLPGPARAALNEACDDDEEAVRRAACRSLRRLDLGTVANVDIDPIDFGAFVRQVPRPASRPVRPRLAAGPTSSP
jgi:HEAT repeat protein